MIVQLLAIIHFFKRRPEWYWFYIILVGGALGATIYIIAEVVPDFDLARAGIRRYSRGSRIGTVEAIVADNPSVANLEELGELYWDQGNYAKAREMFTRAIQTKDDSERTFYLRGQCAFELGDYAAAVADLEQAVRRDPKIDSYRAEMFLAQAYAGVGRADDAAAWFAEAASRSSTPEMLFSYADFLATHGRMDEARRWLGELESKRKSSPRYVQRVERSWFRKGRSLASQLKKAGSVGLHAS